MFKKNIFIVTLCLLNILCIYLFYKKIIDRPIGWDLKVFYCGSEIFFKGLNPYNTNLLWDCLDWWAKENFVYNFSPILLYLFKFSNLIGIIPSFVLINLINILLILKILFLYKKIFKFSNFELYVVLLLIPIIFSSSFLLASYTGNIGLTIVLFFLYLYIKTYILHDFDERLYPAIIFFLCLIKPHYIVFMFPYIINRNSFISSFLTSVLSLTILVFSYKLLLIIYPDFSSSYFDSIKYLYQRGDIGFGILSLFDLFLSNLKNISIFNVQIDSKLLLILLFVIIFYVYYYFNLKKKYYKNSKFLSLFVPILISCLFLRLKVYEFSLVLIPISILIVLVYRLKKSFYFIFFCIIQIIFLIDNAWESYFFFIFAIFTLLLLILNKNLIFKEK